ncbi:transposase [Aquimarina sp. RZ0]|uniref:transposase n=1 Tax=Aquimarina sp. RZ0 TaxID=2607730 RepID=UPI0011F118C0|nr:transposase [Aquimarina sp. RZ0]KAA1244431.1 hypothetical protein F0000_16415 [Aquimarina sp. RZ0]
MISILHIWGQNLSVHPHIHCMVLSEGINKQKRWRQTCSNGKYLFPVKAMSKVFRAIFLKQLKQLKNKVEIDPVNLQSIVDTLFNKPWVVYAKKTFSGVIRFTNKNFASNDILFLPYFLHKMKQ